MGDDGSRMDSGIELEKEIDLFSRLSRICVFQTKLASLTDTNRWP